MEDAYHRLHTVIEDSCLWKGNRRSSHAFLLSPDVFTITDDQKTQLILLGFALNKCLRGLSRLATLAHDPKMDAKGAWNVLRTVCKAGVPKIYHPLQGMYPKDIPRLLKIDFLLDAEGNFRIAEIDGHNKHGLGYATIARRFHRALFPDRECLPGVIDLLSEKIMRLGKREIKILYGAQEIFYLPEMEVAKQEFAAHGIECILLHEEEVDVSLLEEGLFLDMPFLYQRTELYEPLLRAYESGSVRCLIPPKPFFGSKGLLAILRNDTKSRHLEALLEGFIDQSTLSLVRKYIPETFLIGTINQPPSETENHVSVGKSYVLKESISSGMKGTLFPDDKNFSEQLQRAQQSSGRAILQEMIRNQKQTFSWYEECSANRPILHTDDGWMMRVTAHYVFAQLADITITARRDKAVHGAKDCLQLGTVIA